MTIKISKKNEGKKIKINGREEVIDKILANKRGFRAKRGEGESQPNFTLDDIEEAKDFVIDIE